MSAFKRDTRVVNKTWIHRVVEIELIMEDKYENGKITICGKYRIDEQFYKFASDEIQDLLILGKFVVFY